MPSVWFVAPLALFTSHALAVAISCAGAQVDITFDRSAREAKGVEVVLTASRDGRATVLRYDGNVDFIGAECRKTKRGQYLVLFQAYCGGSGCSDLSNFGVIDPGDLRVLLVPSNTSHVQTKAIFGFAAQPISLGNMQSVHRAYERLFPN